MSLFKFKMRSRIEYEWLSKFSSKNHDNTHWLFPSGWLVDPLDRSHNDCSTAAGSETTSEKETENESDD